MYKLYSILERHGFVGIQDAEKIQTLAEKELRKFHNEVFKCLYDSQNERTWGDRNSIPSDFSFQASASIRAANGCSELTCRLRKLDFLARYAALYASELTLPLSMPGPD